MKICDSFKDYHRFSKMFILLNKFSSIASKHRTGQTSDGTSHTPVPWDILRPVADIFGVSESDCESEGISSRLHSLLPQLKEISTTDYSSLRILAKNILAEISSDWLYL